MSSPTRDKWEVFCSVFLPLVEEDICDIAIPSPRTCHYHSVWSDVGGFGGLSESPSKFHHGLTGVG